MPRFGVLKLSGLLIGVGLLVVPTLARPQNSSSATGTSAPAPQEKASAATSDPQASEYAGAESCKECHKEVYNSWEKSAHWQQTYKKGGIAKHGCEDCHGPSASHVSDPTDTAKLFLFKKASAKEIDARCLECHAGGTEHMNALNSVHTKNDVSCISCHSPHHAETSQVPAGEGAARALLQLPSGRNGLNSICLSIIA